MLTYVEAVNAALRRALEERPETILFGEDVGEPGGVFGATKGLRRSFGDRVFDTPISESAILGGAVGAALMGRRPVVEIMWVDFALVALDQIVNQAANVSFLHAGALRAPLTIRTQQGALPGSCAQHSQCLEALFAHIPGLSVAMPATAQDAYDLMLSAIWHDDPVVVIEARGLYFGERAEVSVGGPVPPIGGARRLRSGDAVTVVTWGTTVQPVLDAAALLSSHGVEADVIDLRWVSPIDLEPVLQSLAVTNRLVVVHEANVTGGVGGEVVAQVAERGLHLLDAPVLRIGLPDTRVPAAPHLQRQLLPSRDSIARQVLDLVRSHS
jgi:pyruvate dehydrogenase E1 component beta subunit